MTESIIGTLRRVVDQRREMTVEPYLPQQERPIDKPLFDYFFKAQSTVEKEGKMDYHRYAERLWQELVLGAEIPDTENDKQFRRFEGNLVLGLHNIDMKQHIYGELMDSLGQLVAKFGRVYVRWPFGQLVIMQLQVTNQLK